MSVFVEYLKAERQKLILEKNALNLQIKELGITKSKAYLRAHNVAPEIIETRNTLVKKVMKIDRRLVELKKKLREVNPHPNDGEREYSRLQLQDDLKSYMDLASVLINELIEARKVLTQVNEAGCNTFDKATFLTITRPVNRILKPISDYEKLKRQHHLK